MHLTSLSKCLVAKRLHQLTMLAMVLVPPKDVMHRANARLCPQRYRRWAVCLDTAWCSSLVTRPPAWCMPQAQLYLPDGVFGPRYDATPIVAVQCVDSVDSLRLCEAPTILGLPCQRCEAHAESDELWSECTCTQHLRTRSVHVYSIHSHSISQTPK